MAPALKVVPFCVFPGGYGLVSDWADRHGHDVPLVVTLPGRGHYGGTGGTVVEAAAGRDVLVAERLATAATLVAAVQPDLVVSASFPRRIPVALTEIPRLGALNVHPAPLPQGRGPNPQRVTYEGSDTVGATVHRLAPEFDAGPILSRQERTLAPDEISPAGLLSAWMELCAAALEEGAARAIAGEPGTAQDDGLATYAASFTDAERVLDWSEPVRTLRLRVAALNLTGPTARAGVDGRSRLVVGLRPAPDRYAEAAPGTVLDRIDDVLVVRVGDGAVEVTVDPADDRPDAAGEAASVVHGKPL